MTKLGRIAGAMALAFILTVISPLARAVEVQRVTANGIEAWLVEDHSIPVISVHVAFRGGAVLDPSGKEGLTRLAMALLDEGAGDLDALSFQRRLEDLAVELSFSAHSETVGARMRTLSENRDAAFELLRLALTAPRFDPEPVARVRGQLEARLRQTMQDPDDLASRRFLAEAFPGHPYGRPVDGTLTSIAAITTDDLRAFAAERFARDNVVIGVVGDLTATDLQALLSATFGKLPEHAVLATVPEVLPAAGADVAVIDRPVPQSVLKWGQKGLKRDDPDFYVATVLNHILGGGSFTSRLFEEVREARGLAYSVYTYLHPFDHSALLMGGAATANERVAETIDVVREQWRRLAKDGVSEVELDDAKTYLIGSFPLRFTQSGEIAAMLVGMQLDNLGIDYLDRRNALIDAVTREDVDRLARRLLDENSLIVVVAGQPKGLEAAQ
ncbi:MAG: insulinase family protein [Rhodospirillales bacterium]|nr:insulinase family protein [Rhodospirillales bacterium]